MFRWLKYTFRVLITPSCWFRIYSYSPAWDKILREKMKRSKFTSIYGCTAVLDGKSIWIGSHPYGSFSCSIGRGVLPSRKTVLEAHDKLIGDAFLEKEKN